MKANHLKICNVILPQTVHTRGNLVNIKLILIIPKEKFAVTMRWFTLNPTYNENFNWKKSACYKRYSLGLNFFSNIDVNQKWHFMRKR